jgi:Cation transport ATPase
MSSIHKKGENKMAYIKGAPKKMIALSNQISVGGVVKPFSENEKEQVIKVHDELASSGLRILGMAYRELPTDF